VIRRIFIIGLLEFFTTENTEFAEFFVGAEQEKRAQPGKGSLAPPIIHRARVNSGPDAESAEFYVGAEQKKRAQPGKGSLAPPLRSRRDPRVGAEQKKPSLPRNILLLRPYNIIVYRLFAERA
jgi:hypothetical protein